LHTYGAGQAKLNAYLDDYAFFVDGLIALHEATNEARWLKASQELTDKQVELFWDETEGGFYFTSSDHEELLARSKDPVDSVTPSGNAVAASNLVYLSRASSNPEYLDRARRTVEAFAGFIAQNPGAMPRMAAVWTAIGAAEKNADK
jgi:uncharacterized protein YyaL (SSP411 family)